MSGSTLTSNALASINEHHIHSRALWWGKLAVQTATNWADDTLAPFQAISGADDYGADASDEAQVLGTDDTPIESGEIYFDFHEILIVGVSEDTVYKLRLVWGTGTMADAITADQCSEVMMQFDSVNPQQSAGIPIYINMPRLRSGIDKVWIQAWNITNNATIDFFIGLHEY